MRPRNHAIHCWILNVSDLYNYGLFDVLSSYHFDRSWSLLWHAGWAASYCSTGAREVQLAWYIFIIVIPTARAFYLSASRHQSRQIEHISHSCIIYDAVPQWIDWKAFQDPHANSCLHVQDLVSDTQLTLINTISQLSAMLWIGDILDLEEYIVHYLSLDFNMVDIVLFQESPGYSHWQCPQCIQPPWSKSDQIAYSSTFAALYPALWPHCEILNRSFWMFHCHLPNIISSQ